MGWIRNWLRMRLPISKGAFLLELGAELDRREARISAKLDALLETVADGNAREVTLAERGAAAAERGVAAAERGLAAAERGAAAAEHVVAEIPPNARALDRIHSRVTHLVRRVEERFAKEAGAGALGENIKRMLTLPENESLPVVFITDSGYLRPTCVAISSLIRHRDEKTRYDIHIIGIDLTEKDREDLGGFGAAVHVICPENKYEAFQTEHLYVSKAALFKFDLADLLPEHDRVLYLDSDILALRDLAALFAVDLGRRYAAVVKDYAGTELEHHHEKMAHRDYFNSGMMYLNLEEFRRVGMREKLLEAKATKMFPPHFMDQDAFNLAFAENVQYLSPEYNLMRSNNHLCENLETVATFYGLSLREYLRIETNPAIVHLSNYIKPWDSELSDLYELYWQELSFFCNAEGNP